MYMVVFYLSGKDHIKKNMELIQRENAFTSGNISHGKPPQVVQVLVSLQALFRYFQQYQPLRGTAGGATVSVPPRSTGTRGMSEYKTSLINGR